MARLLALALGVFYGAGGAFMLVDSRSWLSFMVGRQIEGPLPGQHFIYDVGLAFIASAIGFLLFAARPRYWPAVAIGATFPALHAAMHVMSMVQGHSPRLAFDFIVIVAPAVVGGAIAANAMRVNWQTLEPPAR